MDELNSIGLQLKEFIEMFSGFSPVNMLINRTSEEIKIDISALENCTISILSDM